MRFSRRWPAALLAAGLFSTTMANPLTLGAPAPELSLHTLDGKVIDTRALQGQVVLLTFWASWCDPCRQELPLLSSYVRTHAGLTVLGFSLDEAGNRAQVQAIAAKLGFPVGFLPSPWAGGYGRIWHIPVSFVIDRKGRLAYDGWQQADPVWTAATLDSVVGPLLKGAD